MRYENTIEQVSSKLDSGELKPEDFYCPVSDFDHLPNVKVYPNIVLSWNQIRIYNKETGKHHNITKPNQEDYDAESIAEVQHSFNENGVDLNDWPPAVKAKPVMVEGRLMYDLEWGINRHAVLSPRSNKWVFTPVDIPKEDERDAKMHENEPKKRQRYNPVDRIVNNLYEDCLAKHPNLIDETTGFVCEQKLEDKIDRAYGKTRTKPERKSYFNKVIKTIKKDDKLSLKVKSIKKYDTEAKLNSWNKNQDGSKKYILNGERNVERENMFDRDVINQYGYVTKSGSLDRQRDRCLQKAYARPTDKDGNDLEPNSRVSFVFVWVDGETPEEIEMNRKKVISEYDALRKRNEWAGSDESFWYVKGFLNQDEINDKNRFYIPIDEVRNKLRNKKHK